MNDKPRQATERDFRRSEFLDANPEDYEIRPHDGAVVRKDRWEQAVQKVRQMVGISHFDKWEIPDVLEKVEEAVRQQTRLRRAIVKTLRDNVHLADGDVCTLIDLKNAVPDWERAGCCANCQYYEVGLCVFHNQRVNASDLCERYKRGI